MKAFDQKAIPVEVNGEKKWSPAFRLSSGDFAPISRHGEIVTFDTEEKANEWFD